MDGARIPRLLRVYDTIEDCLDVRPRKEGGANKSSDGLWTVDRDRTDDEARQGLRRAFIVWTVALIESEVVQLSRQLPGQSKVKDPVKLFARKNKAAVEGCGFIEKAEKLFTSFGVTLQDPTERSRFMIDLYRLRNDFAHQHGWIDGPDQREKLTLLEALAGPAAFPKEGLGRNLDIVDNEIYVNSKFMEEALEQVAKFLAQVVVAVAKANEIANGPRP